LKTLVLANQKGGVGKSAVASLLAHYFFKEGRRVLAIDLDHQGNLSAPLALSKRVHCANVTSDVLLTSREMPLPNQAFVLVGAGEGLLGLERQPEMHNSFARNFRAFLKSQDERFDVCVVDTHPTPDIRLISALASADFVLSPIQLTQESIDGVRALVMHPLVGITKIKALLNPKLEFIGLLPTMVESTPFQRANFVQLVQRHLSLLIQIGPHPGDLAQIPRRTAIAEAQADGALLWEMKKTAARDAWVQIEPTIRHVANIVVKQSPAHAV
jgi:chromosome partitioning protein